ncbi:hypothetical protein ACFQ3R_14740 [Mesonia ostreae]|uniref:Lipoprotein n=1 Tax=Mesonia ostreae TaxID=861110 RepID=A0ABU2KMI8_9FLAO|nr:hypothetical protein [Mesonia ostreae]MDT0295938.1 hypothetical protein [Mesonia ostreae]
MNKLYILLILILITSCGNQTKFEKQIEKLQSKNDSLHSELKKYENKFVFDNVTIRQYPIKNSTVKKGTKYYGELVFVAVVKEDFLLFGTEKYKSKQEYNIKNPITLKTEKGDWGGYKFEVDIVNDTTKLLFKPLMKNKLSLKHKNALYNEILFSDELIAN